MRRKLAVVMASVMAVMMFTACGGSSTTATTKAAAVTTKAAAAATTKAASAAATTKAASAATTKAAAAGTTAKGGSGGQVTLNLIWWGNQTRNDVTKKACDLYMQKNPNVKINVEFTDWSGYWDKLSAMAAGGNLPDIIQQDYAYITQWQKNNQLADLTPYIEDKTIDTGKISKSVIDSGSINGKCYAISLGSNAPCMVYDKTITSEAGVTIPDQMKTDEFFKVSKTIFDKTKVSTYLQDDCTMLQMMARCTGNDVYEDIKAGKDTSVKRFFQYQDDFAKSDFAINADKLAEKNPDVVETKPIIDKTSWNDFAFSNQFIAISKASGRELAMTMFPQPTDGDKQITYLKPSMFFSIAETSAHKKEAAEFINWFTNDKDCNLILMGERGIPVNSDVAAAVKAKVDDVNKQVYDYVEKVTKVASPIDKPDPSGKGEVQDHLRTYTANIRYKEMKVDDATSKFMSEAKEILNKAK